MNIGKTVFAQLMSFLPDYEFNKCVEKYKGNHRVRNFTCKEYFYVMGFAQLTYRKSLRDIESCLTAFFKKLYHSGWKIVRQFIIIDKKFSVFGGLLLYV